MDTSDTAHNAMTGTRSLMAERAAMLRAAHQLIDDEPRIFSDPLALPILGAAGRHWLHENIAMYGTEPMRRARAMTTIRARFAEEELERAIGQGITQYVILGAGLDTFAYRRADVAERLTIFEVDHPATQQWKLERLAEAGIKVPRRVRFVPLDFNERTLAEGLALGGFDRGAPAFFSWLGVTYYLPRDAVLANLAFIGGLAAPSQVVFDFAVEYSALTPYFQDKMSQVVAQMGRDGELWQTRFVPEDLSAELARLGFSGTMHMTMEMADERYLRNRRDGLLIGAIVQLMSAWRGAGAAVIR